MQLGDAKVQAQHDTIVQTRHARRLPTRSARNGPTLPGISQWTAYETGPGPFRAPPVDGPFRVIVPGRRTWDFATPNCIHDQTKDIKT